MFCGIPDTRWGAAASCDWTLAVNTEPRQGYVMRRGVPALLDLVREECNLKP
jgi:hypothetical protein